jgi:hypothetical protein
MSHNVGATKQVATSSLAISHYQLADSHLQLATHELAKRELSFRAAFRPEGICGFADGVAAAAASLIAGGRLLVANC